MKRNAISAALAVVLIFSPVSSSFPFSRDSLIPSANVSAEVTASPSSYEGPCPGNIKFTARIKSDAPVSIKYSWVRSDGSTSAPEALTFSAPGEQFVVRIWSLGDSAALPRFEGWQQLRILEPMAVMSNRADFTLKCSAGGRAIRAVSPGAGSSSDAPDLGPKIPQVIRNPATPQPQPQPPDCTNRPGGCPQQQGDAGRFRITINGFRCDRRTNDKVLDEDGAKDEVFLRSDVSLYDATTHRNQPTRQSPVMGDSNNRPDRLRAGSASSLGGGNGGFQDGDGYRNPTRPWMRSGSPSDVRPPMIAWEGELARGRTALALIPSIWESDENNRLSTIQWTRAVAETWVSIGPEIRAAIRSGNGTGPSRELLSILTRQFDRVRIPDAANNELDRPIGMERRGAEYGYVPSMLVLTFEAADRVARENSAGLGSGIIPVTFKDDGDLVGKYTIYIQIERMP